VTFTIDVKDYVSQSLVSNVDVSICARTDIDCAHPVAHGSTNETGRVVVTFQEPGSTDFRGFDGYVQLTSPEIVSYRWFWGGPLSESSLRLIDRPDSKAAIRVMTPADATQLGSGLGIAYDATVTALFALVVDCEWHPSSGVQVAISPTSPNVKEFYGLSPTATVTDMSNPVVTFAYVPEGSVDVIATPMATRKPSSRQTVTVRKGWFTDIQMLPTP
jgi:hypothetical protein